MKSQGIPFNKDTLTLAAGTCYKLVMFQIFYSFMSIQHYSLIYSYIWTDALFLCWSEYGRDLPDLHRAH